MGTSTASSWRHSSQTRAASAPRSRPPQYPAAAPAPQGAGAEGAADLQKRRRDLEKELEGIKVSTMHSMVATVTCEVRDLPVEVDFLYLTNDMAHSLPTRSMPKVREQLGIREPKMVIRLLPSHFGSSYWKTFPNWLGDGEERGRFPTKQIPELSDDEQEKTEHHMMLLAKDVLLPLAIRTHSLVIGSESCALTQAFVAVSAPLERHLGLACPFRLLIFAHLHLFHVKAQKDGTVAHYVRKACKPWSNKKKDLDKVLRMSFGEDEAFWPCEDLPTGKYSLIFFECLGKGGLAQETSNNFMNDFIASLSEELPVIALQTYGTNKMAAVPALAEHVMRGLPLMLLDSRPRAPAPTIGRTAEMLEKFSGHLHQRGRVDQYFTSALAFVKASLDAKRRNSLSLATLPDCLSEASGAEEEWAETKHWIYEAIEHRLRESYRKSSSSRKANALAALHEQEEETLVQATNLMMEYVGSELGWESHELQQRCERGIKAVMGAASWEDFERLLQENWLRIRGCCFHEFTEAREFASKRPWIALEESGKDRLLGTKVLRIVRNGPGFDGSPQALEAAKEELAWLLQDSLQESKDYDATKKSRQAFCANQGMWLAIYQILKASNVHAGNLHHLEDVSCTLFSLAQIDRLPERNTLEALILLRAAWTVVDVFNMSARHYKFYSKTAYFLLLVLGVATVTFTTISSVYVGLISTEQQRNTLLALALVGSCITGYAALVDPARKWTQLRSGAYALEADIWKFRTRVGEYSASSGRSASHVRLQDERRAEGVLLGTLLQVQGKVRLSAGLKETSFYSMPITTNDLHTPLEDDDDDDAEVKKGKGRRLLGALGAAGSSVRKAADDIPLLDSTRGLRLSRAHFLHGQYESKPPRRLQKGEDSYHSPAKPEDYIRWRLVPQMQFFQKRIPRYARRRRLFQVIILVSTLLSSLLAALELPHLTAIIATVSGAVAGWQEFLDVARKLHRYSTITASLADVLAWWQALTEVEQANVRNITLLVERTEGLLNEERASWSSEAQQAVRLLAAAGEQAADRQGNGAPRASGGSGAAGTAVAAA